PKKHQLVAERRVRELSVLGHLFHRLPPYTAWSPSISSILRSWLYLASRSVRDRLPVLIWPALVATTKSAMVVSSVSPLRWLTTAVQQARWAMLIACIVSVSVPI